MTSMPRDGRTVFASVVAFDSTGRFSDTRESDLLALSRSVEIGIAAGSGSGFGVGSSIDSACGWATGSVGEGAVVARSVAAAC